MTRYRDFHRRSIENPEAFWREEARRIHWQTPFDTVLETGSRYYFVYPECVASQPKVKLFSEWIMRNREAAATAG